MANTRVNIDVNINTGDAARSLRQLQAQINSFQSALNTNNRLQGDASRYYSQQIKDLANQSGFFTAETVKMRTAASQLDQTLSKGQGTMRQFVSAKFLKDSAAAAQVLSLANSRASALQTQFVATGAAANGFREAVAIRPLQAFNSEATISTQKLAIHRAMLSQSTTSMINFGKNTQWAGRQLMVGFTVPLTIFAATSGKVFREIEKESINFRKVYGDSFTTPEELNANLLAVQGLAKEYTKYGIAVKDTIGLAAQAAAAGSQGTDLIDATTEATRLATLGQMDSNEALETTIALQTAFGLKSKELTKTINFLNMVENQTVVTLQDLAQAIPRVAPVIKGLGGSVEDMAVMLAAMREGGITAAQGANALKSGLASLINPTDRAVESLEKMGVNLNYIVQTNRGDLMGTVKTFAQALSTLDEFQQQQALEKVFGKFQYARLGALFKNIIKDGSQASRVMDAATLSASQLASSAEKELGAIEDSAATKFVAAMEKLKLAIAPIGEMFTEMAIPVLGFLGSLVEKFNSLPDFAKKFIGFGTVITGIIIPAGTMFLGLLMNLAGTLTKFGLVVGVAFKGFAQGGLRGSIEAVSQALNYMSLTELDAANASTQLGTSTGIVNQALRDQVPAAAGADAAIDSLSRSYAALIVQMTEAAALSRVAFVAPGAAMAGAAATGAESGRRTGGPRIRGGPRLRRNFGGTIPGSGNTDTVPAMLTPGEFVVNKQATGENLALLYAINKGKEVPGFNKGGQIPGMQYFGGKFPGGKVQNQDEDWQSDAATFAGKFGTRGNRRTQASNAASSRGSENIYNSLTSNYERGQNVKADSLRYAVERLGFSPAQLGLKTRGNLTFRMSKGSNLAMMRGDLTRDNLLKELDTPDVYYPLSRQLDSYLGAQLDRNVFDRIYREEILKLPLEGISNGKFEKASRNAVRRYLDSAGFPRDRRNSFIRDILQGDTVNANMSLPAIKQALDARGIQYSSGQSKKDLYVDIDGRKVNIGSLAGREAGNLGRPGGVLDYAGLTGSGEAVHANKGGMIPGVQYANIGLLIQSLRRLMGTARQGKVGTTAVKVRRVQGKIGPKLDSGKSLARYFYDTSTGTNRSRQKPALQDSRELGLERYTPEQIENLTPDQIKEIFQGVHKGHIAPPSKINEKEDFLPGLIAFMLGGGKGGNLSMVKGAYPQDIHNMFKLMESKGIHPMSLLYGASKELGYKANPSMFMNTYEEMMTGLRSRKEIFGPQDSEDSFENWAFKIMQENLGELGNDTKISFLERMMSMGTVRGLQDRRSKTSTGEYVPGRGSLYPAMVVKKLGGMIPMLNGGGIAAAANAARGARGRIPANIVEWFSRMTTSISQTNRDDMLQNIPANIRRGFSTARKKIDITRGSVDPIDGGTLKEVSSWSTGQGVGRFMESSRLFETMNNSKFQIAQRSQGMKRDIDWLRSLGPDGPHPLKTWSPFNQENGALGLRLTPEEIQASGGVIWKANKKKLEERIKRDQEFIAGHQKIIDDLQESNIPTVYRTSIKKGERYFDVSGRIVPRDEQRINNPAASNAILDEKEVALLGARLTGRPKTRIVEREEAQARYDKAKEEIKRIRMAIFSKEMSAEKAKPDLDRLHDETENMAAFVNWGRGREVFYPNVVSRNMGGMIPQMRNIGGQIFDSTKTSRTIVPGVGNKDTVPAMLTPGEFVINKDSTRKNLDLLRSVNNGTIRGYAKGDIVDFGNGEYRVEEEDGKFSDPISKKEAKKRSRLIKTKMSGGRGMSASMGMGAIGGAMMMAPMIPAIGENPTLSGALSGAGMGMSILSVLPMLGMGGPLTLGIAAAGAGLIGLGLVIKGNMEAQDEAARKAAELGANLGGTSNALKKMSGVLGMATPAEARSQIQVGFDDKALRDAAAQFGGIVEGEAFQSMISELKEATSQERITKLTDYLRNAVAAGMMKEEDARKFAKVIGLMLQDPAVGAGVATAIKGQLSGPQAMLDIASGRSGALENDSAMQRMRSGEGFVESAGQEASKIIGGSFQIIQDAANAEALARQQFAEGLISFETYSNVINEAESLQLKYNAAIGEALDKTTDFGSTMQGIKDQLVKGGFVTEEQFNAIDQASTNAIEASLYTALAGFATSPESSPEIGATMVINSQSGQQDFLQNLDPSQYKDFTFMGQNPLGIAPGSNVQETMDSAISATKGGTSALSTMREDFLSAIAENPAGLANYVGLTDRMVGDPTKGIKAEIGLSDLYSKFSGKEGVTASEAFDATSVADQINKGLIPGIGSRDENIGSAMDNFLPKRKNQEDRKITTDVFANFIFQGGDPTTFQTFLLSIPEEKKMDVVAAFKDANQADREAWINDFGTIQSMLGPNSEGLATEITLSAKYQDSGAGERENILNGIREFDKLPSFVEKEAIYALETNDGKDPLSREDAEKRIKSYNKIFKDMGSKDKSVRQKAEILLASKYNGKPVTQKQMNAMTKDVKNWDSLDIQSREEIISIIADVQANFKINGEFYGLEGVDASAPLEEIKKQIEAQILVVKNQIKAAEAFGADTSIYQASLAKFEQALNGVNEGIQEVALISGSGPSGKGSSGGGGTKSIMEQLKEEFENLKKIYNSMGQFINSKKGQFKGIMAGPFGPEFINYLRSQGEEGLKILNGGIDKIKAAYEAFKKVRVQNMSNFAKEFPATVLRETQNIAIKNKFTERLDKAGFDAETSDQFIEGMGGVDAIRAYNQIKKKDKDKRTEDEQETFVNMNKAIAQGGSAVKNYLAATTFDGASKSLKDMNHELDNTNKLLQMGYTKEETDQIASLGDVSNLSAGQIKKLGDSVKAYNLAVLASDPEALAQMKRDNAAEIRDIQRQIEEIGSVRPLEDLLKAQQKIIDGQEKLVRVKQQEVDVISRAIELKQRELEPLDDQIEKLQEVSDKTSEAYDAQIEALDEIYNKEENIAKLKQGQLDVAQALSRGDVAAAAQGALGMSQELARQSREEARSALQSQKDLAIKNIQNQILEIEKQKKKINQDIEDLQMRQRAIQDDIYTIQNTKILPAENEIYRLQGLINVEADRLADKYKSAADEMATLVARLKDAKELESDLANAGNKPPAPTTPETPAFTPQTGPTGLVEVSPGNYIAPGFGITLTNPTPTQRIENPFGLSGLNIQPRMYGGKISKYLMGGRVGYKGSTERAPGMMYGGSAKKYAYGSTVPGRGMTDKVPALLTPGEFVVRKRVAEQYGPLLESLNGQVFPKENFDKDNDEYARRKRDMDMMRITEKKSSSSLIDAVREAARGPIDKILAISNQNQKDRVRLAVEPNRFNADKLNDFRAMSNEKVFPTMKTNSFNSSSQTQKSGSMYNYNVNVTLNGSDMDANDVANAVMQKIKMTENKGIRSNNIRG